MPALNIADVIYHLTNICAVAFGTAVGIITGQMLGAGESEETVRDANRKLIALTVFCGFCMWFPGMGGGGVPIVLDAVLG